MPHPQDSTLLKIVGQAFAASARQSGDFLLCRPGCTQCCVGVFPISQLDALRLRDGLGELQRTEPARAEAIRQRAHASLARLSDYPGDTHTGVLYDDPAAEEKFSGLGNDEPCPALSPETGRCELYASRPMTCRVFGPPIRSGEKGTLGVCELCYHGASSDQIAACELIPDPQNLEAALIKEAENAAGHSGNTIIAFCLAD